MKTLALNVKNLSLLALLASPFFIVQAQSVWSGAANGITLGGTGDLGIYVLENTGTNPVQINYNTLNSNDRGITLKSVKADHITLNSDVEMNYVGGTSKGVFKLDNSENNSYQVNGNGKTITINGNVRYATSGNNSALKNGTVDLRNSTASTTVGIASSTLFFMHLHLGRSPKL